MIKQFLQQALLKLQRFMYGRYGGDELNRLMSIVSLVLVVLSFFWWYLYIPALLLMILSTYRTFSKNIVKRQKEREVYLRLTGKLRTKCRLYKRMWKERKTHRYFKCKQCKAVIRIPKGRGTVEVGCPRCHTVRTWRPSGVLRFCRWNP